MRVTVSVGGFRIGRKTAVAVLDGVAVALSGRSEAVGNGDKTLSGLEPIGEPSRDGDSAGEE